MSAYGYRPDIDGLRAIAILLVVIYHAFPSAMPNGFVGVDVFFVISGFLITSIIQAEKSFSVARFYERRVRRLAPALLVVLFSVLLFGSVVLFESELKQIAKHVVAGLGFSANIVFWLEAGYFDSSAEFKPLLHLWSLGVEEQFYLIWPLVLLLAIRMRSQMAVTASLFFASFIGGVYTVGIDQPSAFFLPFTRVWELLAGAALAGSAVRLNGRLADTCSILGIVLIASCVFIEIPREEFPGWYALLPVLGSCMLIAAGEHAVVNRVILSIKPMVWIGLISYPLYLWHWPIISYVHIISVGEVSSWHLTVTLFSALLLAAATYLLLERPVRSVSSRRVILSVIALSVVLVFSSWSVYSGGIDRYRESLFPGDSKAFTWVPRNSAECGEYVGIKGLGFCIKSDDNPSVALIGDSFSNHHYYGLAEELKKSGLGVINIGLPGCAALRNISEVLPNAKCSGSDEVIDYVKSNPGIKTVILAGSWHSVRLYKKHADLLRVAVDTTVGELIDSGKQVIFLDAVPAHGLQPKSCVARPLYLGRHDPDLCEISLQNAIERAGRPPVEIRNALAKHPSAIYTDMLPLMCSNGVCPLRIDGKLMFRDGHLSLAGSYWIAPRILKAWEKSGVEIEANR
ncbi:acyltransferase [Pseudomonas toyotomiensis]|uniref:Acyltransferase n=1 Tax=Ectopseudomonas toyotomiensis TaxID=554344 RepID=A0AA42IRT3_9GAMM|nr:acyltransferase family protein [Pseudomonas toyotomiensis]MDH0704334.1 acyltransferase [Pseudomonas toyotomiensis]